MNHYWISHQDREMLQLARSALRLLPSTHVRARREAAEYLQQFNRETRPDARVIRVVVSLQHARNARIAAELECC